MLGPGLTVATCCSQTVLQSLFLQPTPALYQASCTYNFNSLAISDALKNCKVCRDALDIAFETTKLIKFRNVLFDKTQSEAYKDNGSAIGIRTFCPRRWIVKGDSIAP